jgi:hypothetical protein
MWSTRNRYGFLFASLAIGCLVGSQAVAAPVVTPTSLPLDDYDLIAAQDYITGEELEEFAYFIKGLDVFADHENPSTIAGMSNRSIIKKYYITPYFQALESDGVVGAQEIAEQGLMLLLSTIDLVESFDMNLVRIQEIQENLESKEKALENFYDLVEDTDDPELLQTYLELINDIEDAIDELKAEYKALLSESAEGVEDTPIRLRIEVADQIRLKLAFLGISATSSEEADLASNDPARMVDALTSLIKRTTTAGQFGVRQVVYKSGYTSKERNFISIYRLVRSDVQVNSLSPSTVYAKSTSVSAANDSAFTFNKYVDGARLFLGINLGSKGRCGNTRACNVTMDLSWLGSTMAQTSRSGALVVPVTFEADVSVMRPDFDGQVWCDFETGWQAKGRADVKDGAIIYDGDVYNKIHYEAFENGECSYRINEGSAESAAYYAIKNIYDTYMRLKMARGAKARDEKDAYQDYVNRELQWHADNSSNDYDFWGYRRWTLALGPVWGTVTSFVIGATRSFYWHTRIEDQKTTDKVKFNTRITERNVQETQRISFDGDPIVCWKGTLMNKYIGACPSEFKEEYEEEADHDVGWNDALCGDDGVSADCLEEAEEAEEDETVDENGVTDPWA